MKLRRLLVAFVGLSLVASLTGSAGAAKPHRKAPARKAKPRPPRRATPVPAVEDPTPEPVTTAPPPAPEPVTPVAPVKAAKAPKEPKARDERPRPAALDVGIGAGIVTRVLTYNDDIFGKLRGYERSLAPSLNLSLAWFPGAHFSSSWWAHIGLEAHGSYAFFTGSRSEGMTYPTRAYSFDIGLLGRIPLGRFLPEIGVGYGMHGFEISDISADVKKPQIPSVVYSFVRIAAGLRVEATRRIFATAHFGYRLILSAGEFQSAAYFPRSRIDGVDVDVGFGVVIWRGLQARAAFDMQRYFSSLKPEPGDPFIAGGAVDEYLGGTLEVAYRF